jgi:hypothetical protein
VRRSASFPRGSLRCRGVVAKAKGKARGIKLGNKSKLTENQNRETILLTPPWCGEPVHETARSNCVSHGTISTLTG